MNAVLYDVALTAYIVAMVSAFGHLLGRREGLARFTRVMTETGFTFHTVALVVRGVELSRIPIFTLPEAVSVVIWVTVLLERWAERQYGVKVLAVFVLPVVVMLGLGLPTGLRTLPLAHAARSAWIWVHVGLALLGLAALVLNFAGAVMYLLQERQLKTRRRRPGKVYYRLPSLETLDRLTYRTLTLGFPFLTAGLVLGALWAPSAWGSLFAFDPLALFSIVMWAVYAVMLSARMVGRGRGRRAAYFSIAGFAVLLLSLGAGVILQGRHGL
ncbi:MAG TPA: cytochrome c biogenesis protein CcsA [Candidatus Limnocylindrales bacterium]|nr:cytochrome c biogenesis protein CcsA [Candidatus Limnocylindrales bacterium]